MEETVTIGRHKARVRRHSSGSLPGGTWRSSDGTRRSSALVLEVVLGDERLPPSSTFH